MDKIIDVVTVVTRIGGLVGVALAVLYLRTMTREARSRAANEEIARDRVIAEIRSVKTSITEAVAKTVRASAEETGVLVALTVQQALDAIASQPGPAPLVTEVATGDRISPVPISPRAATASRPSWPS